MLVVSLNYAIGNVEFLIVVYENKYFIIYIYSISPILKNY